MRFLRPGWVKINRMCIALAKKAAPFKPDWIVGISRGGLVPARLLSDILGIKKVSIVRVEFYSGLSRANGFPRITQPLQADVKGKKVLLVDDVSDSGKSLAIAKDHIKRKGASQVKIAALHYKPKSILKPDFYIEETNSWIVYPWEVFETKRELKGMK